MDVISAIKNRREITQYLPKPISDEHRTALIDAGYYSVTGNNLPSREFIVSDDRDTLDKLSHATPFVPWLTQVPFAITIVGNPDVSKYWLQDATIATSNIWLVATDLDLGAAWGAIHHSEDEAECARREQVVREVLGIPNHLRPVSIIGIGHAAAPAKEKQMVPRSQVIHMGPYNAANKD